MLKQIFINLLTTILSIGIVVGIVYFFVKVLFKQILGI